MSGYEPTTVPGFSDHYVPEDARRPSGILRASEQAEVERIAAAHLTPPEAKP